MIKTFVRFPLSRQCNIFFVKVTFVLLMKMTQRYSHLIDRLDLDGKLIRHVRQPPPVDVRPLAKDPFRRDTRAALNHLAAHRPGSANC